MSIFDNCMYFSTNQLARHLNTIADEAFKDTDYTATQGFTMIAIGKLGKHTPSEISEELGMKPSTITRFLDKLVKLGYVERHYLGRNTEVNLTPKGCAEVDVVDANWKEIERIIIETFSEDVAGEATAIINVANLKYKEKNN